MGGYFFITSMRTGLVVGPESLDSRARAVLQVRDSGDDAQLWQFDGGMIRCKKTGLVLGIPGGEAESGTQVVLEQPGGRASQLWDVVPETRQLRSRLSPGLVLDISGAGAEPGIPVCVRTPETPVPDHQCWRLVPEAGFDPVESRWFSLVMARTGLVAEAGPAGAGVTLQSRKEGRHAQLWRLGRTGLIVNRQTGQALEPRGGSGVPGTPVITAPPKEPGPGAASQEWALGVRGSISSALGGLSLGVAEGPPSAGAVVAVCTPAESDSQRWRIERNVTPEPAQTGRAVRLDGVRQAVTGLPEIAAQDFTVEAWVRTAAGGPVFASTLAGLDIQGLLVAIRADGALLLCVRSADGRDAELVTAGTTAADGGWHHLAVVRQGRNAVLYLDGTPVPAKSLAPSYDLGSAAAHLTLGTAASTGKFTTLPGYWLRGDLDEVRVWTVARTAGQIADGMHHPVSGTAEGLWGRYGFDDDNAADSTPAQHGGTLAGSPTFIDSEVEVTSPGDYYLVTQARLIHDYVQSPRDPAEIMEVSTYRVTIGIRDGNDRPAAGFVTIAADDGWRGEVAVLFLADGSVVKVTRGLPDLTLGSDAQGVISFGVMASDQLALPLLLARADFMPEGTSLVIAPDAQAHAALTAVTGQALLGTGPDGGRSPLPAGTHPDTADAVAQAIAHTMSTAVNSVPQGTLAQVRPLAEPLNAPLPRPCLSRFSAPSLAARGHDPGTDVIATPFFTAGTAVTRVLIPQHAPNPHWSFDSSEGHRHRFSVLTVDNAVSELNKINGELGRVGELAKKIDFGPDVLTGRSAIRLGKDAYATAATAEITDTDFRWSLRDHIRDAVKVLVNTATVHIVDEADKVVAHVQVLVVTAVDSIQKAAYAVITDVEHAGQVVQGFLEKVGSDVTKLIDFIKALFEWDDILTVQQVMRAYVQNAISGSALASTLQSSGRCAAGDIAGLRASVDRDFAKWKHAVVGDGSLQDRSRALATSSLQSVKSSYLSTKLSQGLHDLMARADKLIPVELPPELEDFASSVESAISAAFGSIEGTLAGAFDTAKITQAVDPRAILTEGLDLFLDAIQSLADLVFGVAEAACTAIAAAIRKLLDGITALVSRRIEIPHFTQFCEQVIFRGKEELTILNLVTLLGAAVYTIESKAATGERPMLCDKEQAKLFHTLSPEDYTWLANPFSGTAAARRTAAETPTPEWLKALNKAMAPCFAFGNFLWAVAAMADDLLWWLAPEGSDTERFWQIPPYPVRKIFVRIFILPLQGLTVAAGLISASATASVKSDTASMLTLAANCVSAVSYASNAIATFSETYEENIDGMIMVISGTAALVLSAAALSEGLQGSPDENDKAAAALSFIAGAFGGIGLAGPPACKMLYNVTEAAEQLAIANLVIDGICAAVQTSTGVAAMLMI